MPIQWHIGNSPSVLSIYAFHPVFYQSMLPIMFLLFTGSADEQTNKFGNFFICSVDYVMGTLFDEDIFLSEFATPSFSNKYLTANIKTCFTYCCSTFTSLVFFNMVTQIDRLHPFMLQ